MITIDPRAGSKELMRYLPDSMASLGQLEYCDASWLGNGPDDVPHLVGVEVKTISDLLNSIVTGRLSGHQLIGMLNAYNFCYLMIVGIWRASPDNGLLEVRYGKQWRNLRTGKRSWPSSMVENYLNSLSVCCGVVVRTASSDKDAARQIVMLYNWWQKSWDAHKSFKQTIYSKSGVPKRSASVTKLWAAALPGIGEDRADAADRVFETPFELACADEAEWLKIEGVGKKVASKVVETIRGK